VLYFSNAQYQHGRKDRKKMNETLSTEELIEELKKESTQIIDIRSNAAYNGWQLQKEKRGGHIPGAKNLPHKWFSYLDWFDIVQAKNIQPQQNIILYGYDAQETEQAAQQFKDLNFPNVHIYHHFTDEWCLKNDLPLEKLPRYQHLVPPEWLYELLTTGSAPTYQNETYALLHVHYQNISAYTQGHIPQAIALDTNLLESSDTWNVRSSKELEQVFQTLGITANTTVILYGRFSNPDYKDPFPGSSAGQLGAFRCAALMLYAGVKDVRMLDGGLQSWVDSGYDLTTKEYLPSPVNSFGTSIPQHPEYLVDIAQAKNILEDNQSNLVSVRSWREYIGEVSGYHYIKKKGRIPGAVFGNCGSDAYHMENYRNLDHTMREYPEIEQTWKEAEITKNKNNAFYCGTGWRASEAFFSAWLMGWPNISVFDGGWYEWSEKNNPYETGTPTTKTVHIKQRE